ncbi:MAG: uroporphyrinogen-III C-methyltransferase [bacterium]|nr:uroporphyrinogen-III C-methyltransferase [bacterium]
MYPIMYNVTDRPCLVVGGGGVALRKLEALLANGARVTLVTPEPIDALEDLGSDGTITLERRVYRAGEVTDYCLAIAATDDREVNRQVYEEANAAGIPVNVVDDPPLCSFHLPARVQRGKLQIAIASEGEAPFAVRRLRRLLEHRFGHPWAEWMEAAGRFRDTVRALDMDRDEQEASFDAFFGATVDPDTFAVRIPTESEENAFLLPQHDTGPANSEAPARARNHAQADTPLPMGSCTGLVSLVGGGPGDAGLLTLRGRQRMMEADAVVYDRLAATSLPTDLPVHVELHCVGKTAGYHPVPQEEINALIVRLAREGKRVVRLKGGDPYVFGRGSEEAEDLREAGICFEIVPGITSAVAVPAYAGMPVTHRSEAVRATMVTAHESAKSDGPQVRWDLMAQDPHATLLGYMGVTSLPVVVERLLVGGLDPATPAAMISRGTTSAQHVVKAAVAELPKAIIDEDLKPPALFIIGPTVAHAEHLDWFTPRPLHGHRLVLVGKPRELGARLELAGAEVVAVPLPVTPASRIVMGALPISGCVFRNAEEVEALEEERLGLGWGRNVVAWCIDANAAERARRLGWQIIEELGGSVTETDPVSAFLSNATRR